MDLKIVTPDKTVYEGKILNATFPGVEGEFQILENHAPLIGLLKKGAIKLTLPKGGEKIDIQEGVVNVNKNEILVLAEV